MKLKTVTWNIGGGKLLNPGADPTLLASYTVDGLDDIVDKLKKVDPDIIALQEVEGNQEANQIAHIAGELGLRHFFYDPTSASHIDTTQSLGNGIISKHPITEHRAGFFYNPDVEFDLEGTKVKSHDKGYGECLITVEGLKIRTTTLHLLPLRWMGIELDSEIARRVFESVTDEVSTEDDHVLIQGDFNIDSSTVREYLGPLFERNDVSEIVLEQPTTPKDRKYDHVLFKGLQFAGFQVDASVKTDHYPVISTFDTEV